MLHAAYGVLTTAVGQALVLTKGPLDLLRGGTRGEQKLLKNARDEVVTEALEIAIYDAIEALAQALGDEPTARLAARHRAQEEQMLTELRAAHPAPRPSGRAGARRRSPELRLGRDRRGRLRPLRAPHDAEAGRHHAPPAGAQDAAADLRLRLADRERGGRQAHRLHAGAAEGDDRLRALAPQAHDGGRARQSRCRRTSRSTAIDELTAREVAQRLTDADEATARRVREYEGRHQRRVEVLETAQRQLSGASS